MDYVIALIGGQGIIIVIERDTEEKEEEFILEQAT